MEVPDTTDTKADISSRSSEESTSSDQTSSSAFPPSVYLKSKRLFEFTASDFRADISSNGGAPSTQDVVRGYTYIIINAINLLVTRTTRRLYIF